MAGVSLKCGDCGALLKSVEEAQEHAELTSHSNFSVSTEAVLNLVCFVCGKPCRSKTGWSCQRLTKKLLEELEAMGFSTARGTCALHFSGNTSLEAAVNWVVEHEADPDIDQMPMVPVSKNVEAPKPSLTPEERKLKAQELS